MRTRDLAAAAAAALAAALAAAAATASRRRRLRSNAGTSPPRYAIGIEGGASGTRAVCVSLADGRVVGRSGSLPGSNQFLMGVAAAAAVCAKAARAALADAGADARGVAAVGMALSGADTKAACDALARKVSATLGVASVRCETDCVGSLWAGCGAERGGLVCIAGTGSAAMVLARGTGATKRVGGWGHFAGDEGSGFELATSALRTVFRAVDVGNDDLAAALHAAALSCYGVPCLSDLMDVLYGPGFQKSTVASFAKNVAACAAGGDPLALSIVRRSGAALAALVAAAASHATAAMLADPKGVRVLCVGSVWLSYDLFRDALADGLRAASFKRPAAYELVRLRDTSALGAAAMVQNFPIDRDALVEHMDLVLMSDCGGNMGFAGAKDAYGTPPAKAWSSQYLHGVPK